MIRRPPRSTQSRSSAASDVYKRQAEHFHEPSVDVLMSTLPYDRYPVIGVLNCRPVPLLAFRKRLFCLFALRDVPHRTLMVDEPSCAVAGNPGVDGNPVN